MFHEANCTRGIGCDGFVPEGWDRPSLFPLSYRAAAFHRLSYYGFFLREEETWKHNNCSSWATLIPSQRGRLFICGQAQYVCVSYCVWMIVCDCLCVWNSKQTTFHRSSRRSSRASLMRGSGGGPPLSSQINRAVPAFVNTLTLVFADLWGRDTLTLLQTIQTFATWNQFLLIAECPAS